MTIRRDSPHLSRHVVSQARQRLRSRVAGEVCPHATPRGFLTACDSPALTGCRSKTPPIRSPRGHVTSQTPSDPQPTRL